ncbi:MAG: hypothetical protein IV094_23420 [Vitreoscilla sp.]|nr:hypothetical protein [Vitreoscilla sp.]
MSDSPKSPWTSLEVVKLAISLLTPIVIFVLGYQVNQSFRAADQARAEALLEAQRVQKQLDEEKQLARAREDALGSYSRLIYERRVRAELLASSLNRHARGPTSESKQELVERKRAYDEAYANWNANTLANLLLVRQIVSPANYSTFEGLVEFRLSRTFATLDACLTSAYDMAIRARDPRPTLKACEAPQLIQRSLDCGYAIIDELFKMSSSLARVNASTTVVDRECPKQ